MSHTISRGVFVIAALLISVCGFIPVSAHAHGGGLSLATTTAGYFIDIDYGEHGVVAGETGRFDFKLFKDASSTKPVEFTQVWVRIVRASDIHEGDTVFSGWIAKALLGSTGFSISLPASGEYKMIARYNNGDNEIVEAAVPFTVEAEDEHENALFDFDFFKGLAAGIVIGLFVLAVLRKKKTL